MVFCSNCGNENEDTSKFCVFCGNKLSESNNPFQCLNCGTINEKGSNFCQNCGTTLNNRLIVTTNDKKEFKRLLKYYVGGILPSDFYMKKTEEHNKSITDSSHGFIKDIMKTEFKNGKLPLNNMENRLDELLELDVKSMKMDLMKKGFDTSLIKTPNDLYKTLSETYGEERAEESKMKDKNYRKISLFKKYGINIENAYCFECTIEERKSSTFSNTDNRNVDNAYVALFDEYIAIIKESVWLKSDMGMRKVYFNNVASIDYDTAGKLGVSSSLFFNLKSAEHVQLKFVDKKDVDEVHNRFEKYMAKINNTNDISDSQNISSADELLKYANLYEKGLLTDEEFAAMKKKLIGGE